MRNFVAMIAALLVAVMGFATAQQGDVIKLNGHTYTLLTNPLESLLEQEPSLSEFTIFPDPEQPPDLWATQMLGSTDNLRLHSNLARGTRPSLPGQRGDESLYGK